MKKLILLALLLLAPQLAAARVYMCVDAATGKASFTDRACETSSVREEVRVEVVNFNSGDRHIRPEKSKTWRSESDTRKTGIDYNEERRGLYANKATVATQ